MRKLDVTALVTLADNPDDTQLPLQRCVCGKVYQRWELSISSEDADEMPCCGRRLTWEQAITVFELIEDPPS